MWQVIFQVFSKEQGKWLDYCREPSDHKDFVMVQRWALDECERLQKVAKSSVFRAKYEFWK